MWIGFRKRLGKGFSVGVGTRLTGGKKSRPRQSYRSPTKAELAKAEKAQFLGKVADDANAHYNVFLKQNYVDVKQLEADGKTVDEHFAELGKDQEYQAVKQTMLEIKELVEKIEYGASLTAKRREQLIDSVFKLRELSPTRSGSIEGKESVTTSQAVGSSLFKRRMIVLAGIWLFFIVISILGDPSEFSVSFVFASALIAVVLWLPYYLISRGLELWRERRARVRA